MAPTTKRKFPRPTFPLLCGITGVVPIDDFKLKVYQLLIKDRLDEEAHIRARALGLSGSYGSFDFNKGSPVFFSLFLSPQNCHDQSGIAWSTLNLRCARSRPLSYTLTRPPREEHPDQAPTLLWFDGDDHVCSERWAGPSGHARAAQGLPIGIGYQYLAGKHRCQELTFGRLPHFERDRIHVSLRHNAKEARITGASGQSLGNVGFDDLPTFLEKELGLHLPEDALDEEGGCTPYDPRTPAPGIAARPQSIGGADPTVPPTRPKPRRRIGPKK